MRLQQHPFSATQVPAFCEGQTAVLATYSWDNGSAGAAIQARPLENTIYVVSGTDAKGCTGTASVSVVVAKCTGIAQYAADSAQLAAFPNPSSGELTLKGYKAEHIVIYNSFGKLVKELELNDANNYSVKITGLSSCLYLIRASAKTINVIVE